MKLAKIASGYVIYSSQPVKGREEMNIRTFNYIKKKIVLSIQVLKV